MEYATVNENGRNAFIQWLKNILIDVQFASDIADDLISNFDGSYQTSIEVRSSKTKSGYPETYVFSNEELNWHEIKD